jgi:hypothetical protein
METVWRLFEKCTIAAAHELMHDFLEWQRMSKIRNEPIDVFSARAWSGTHVMSKTTTEKDMRLDGFRAAISKKQGEVEMV